MKFSRNKVPVVFHEAPRRRNKLHFIAIPNNPSPEFIAPILNE